MLHVKTQMFAPSKDIWGKKFGFFNRGENRCWSLQVKFRLLSSSSGVGAALVPACQGTGPDTQKRSMQMHTISNNKVISDSGAEVL